MLLPAGQYNFSKRNHLIADHVHSSANSYISVWHSETVEAFENGLLGVVNDCVLQNFSSFVC